MGFQEPETYHHLIEAMRLSFSDGFAHISDPSSMRISVDQLLSKDYAADRAKNIDPDETNPNFATGYEIPHSDTVYLTVIDREGNACSLINSIYSGFGSGHVIPGTGVVLQSRGASFSLDPHHPNYLQPGKRPFHTLIPGMATKNDELWISYGVMGTVQQAQGHFQMMVNMVDFDLSPQESLNAPRFSVRTGEGIGIESFADGEISRSLYRKGHKVIIGEPDNLIFGGGQIIQRDPVTGVITGGTEPRQDGSVAAW
jgi:gamma-glutamyltranspeptidase/glutathione hydrolase